MSKARFLLYSFALTSFTFPLLNCGSSAHEPTEAYLLVTVNTKVPYWQAAAAGLADAAREMKVQSETLGPDTYDPQAERQELRKAMARKPSGILISVADVDVLKPEIDAAVGQGIAVITIDADAPASKRLLFVGTQNYDAGRMGGNLLAKHLSGKGNVVIYTIPEQVNLQERLHGYQEALKAFPGIKVQEIINIKGDPRVAFDRTKDFVDKKAPVDAYVCLEALACPEVAEVLNRENVKGKVVIAMDTDPRTIDWIQKGLVAATIAQKPYTMAYFGTKMLDMLHHQKLPSLQADWAHDTRSPIPAFVDTGVTLIDKSSVDTFLKANPAPAK